MKKQVQDTVVDAVQQFVREYFADKFNAEQIEDIDQEIELRILNAFYEHGITSSPNSFKIY